MDIEKILAGSNSIAIAVVGDICLDLYYFIAKEAAEVSVETGLQTCSVVSYKMELGGAANVAVNCKRLGTAVVDLYGLVGADSYGDMVRTLLQEEGIGDKGVLIQQERWTTHVYHKIYDGNSELPRYDIGNFNTPDEKSIDQLIELLEASIEKYRCVIINEQVLSGLHSAYTQSRLNELVEKTYPTVLWFADCRKLNDVYQHTIHKLNEQEGRAVLRSYHSEEGFESNRELLSWLYNHWRNPVVLTQGENGALVHDGDAVHEINGLYFSQDIDIVGAGDAFLAALAVASGCNCPLFEAAQVGNFAAGVSLCKLYETGHPTKEEISAIAADPDYRYHPHIAADRRQAIYAEGTDIEVVNADALQGKRAFRYPTIAIFDHDGTISTLRQGWEDVMERMMMESILGEHSKELPIKERESVRENVRSLIEKTTGIQTIEQMHQLRSLVIRYGYQAPSHILDPLSYKRIYNEKLLAHMAKKLDLLAKGKLSYADVTIKGAVEFLEELYSHGTRLYLASGTDQEDVVQEATLIGYAHVFTGGIKGSVNDMYNDPKRLVIKNIIREMEEDRELDPSSCVVFGDGPVEMREAKKHQFLAVGVLSDERQRYGCNEAKRERLILGGADVLIPDFSWGAELAKVCRWT